IPGRVVGTLYEFVIPNFYDPLPMKKIEISMHGANGGASGFELPGVLDIIGADSDFTNGGPALPVLGSFVSNTISSTLVTEYWTMFPNPDFEIVKLFVPVEFELQNITISTQSTVVPVPAAVWLFGSGILGLAAVARRKIAV
ncbi:MAG: VPLPA-CTERM sorting domain-containing protein, partial [Gammaproteobacteria bacterium]